MKKGFTLIEILIVVAIIAILASVVLVGLGPSQQSRAAMRTSISDLREVQNGASALLQQIRLLSRMLSHGACSTTASWDDLATALQSVDVTSFRTIRPPVPAIITARMTMAHAYVLGASLEDPNRSIVNHSAPVLRSGVTVSWVTSVADGDSEH